MWAGSGSPALTAIHGQQEAGEPEPAHIVVDEAGNVREKRHETIVEPDGRPAHSQVPAGNIGKVTSSTESGQRPQKAPQPQLQLETLIVIGDVKITATELRQTLYRFIPASGKVDREQLLEKVSENIGCALEKARPDLNRLIDEERFAGRLEVTRGNWAEVWRA